jgi:transposase
MGRRNDYNREQRMRRAAGMADRGYSVPEMAHALAVSEFTVYLWLRIVRPGHVQAPHARHLAAATAAGYATVQAAVVGLAEAGATYLEIEARLGMCAATVARYLQREQAQRALRRSRRRGLKRETED